MVWWFVFIGHCLLPCFIFIYIPAVSKLCSISLSLTYFTNEVVETNVHSTIPSQAAGVFSWRISSSMEMLDHPRVTKMRYSSKKRNELWSLRGWCHHSSLNHSVACHSNPKKYPMFLPSFQCRFVYLYFLFISFKQKFPLAIEYLSLIPVK